MQLTRIGGIECMIYTVQNLHPFKNAHVPCTMRGLVLKCAGRLLFSAVAGCWPRATCQRMV